MENTWTTLKSQFYAKTVGTRKLMSQGKVVCSPMQRESYKREIVVHHQYLLQYFNTILCLFRRFTPTVASGGFTSPTDCIRKMKSQQNSSCTCPSRAKPKLIISGCDAA